jgi:hypothetical protein
MWIKREGNYPSTITEFIRSGKNCLVAKMHTVENPNSNDGSETLFATSPLEPIHLIILACLLPWSEYSNGASNPL